MESREGSKKCKTSSAGGSEDNWFFSFGGVETSNAEYAGGSSLIAGRAKVALAGRGEGGSEYAGGSRRPCGNDEGPVEILNCNVAVSTACMGLGYIEPRHILPKRRNSNDRSKGSRRSPRVNL